MTIAVNNPSDTPFLGASVERSETDRIGYDKVSDLVMMDGVAVQDPKTLFHWFGDLLDSMAVEIPLEEAMRGKPEHLSHRLYDNNTPELWWVLLWLNNMTGAWDFDGQSVRVLDPLRLDEFLAVVERWRGRRTIEISSEDAWLRRLPGHLQPVIRPEAGGEDADGTTTPGWRYGKMSPRISLGAGGEDDVPIYVLSRFQYVRTTKSPTVLYVVSTDPSPERTAGQPLVRLSAGLPSIRRLDTMYLITSTPAPIRGPDYEYVRRLTRAEYDALAVKEPDTLYSITD